MPQQQIQQPQQTLKSPCNAGDFGTLRIPGSPEYGWICNPVPPGFYAPAGATAPIPCPTGTVSYGRAEVCRRLL